MLQNIMFVFVTIFYVFYESREEINTLFSFFYVNFKSQVITKELSKVRVNSVPISAILK